MNYESKEQLAGYFYALVILAVICGINLIVEYIREHTNRD